MGVLFHKDELLRCGQEVCVMLKNLKLLREETGITQKQLAECIGVSQQSINKYENHYIEPDIATLIRIAEYFNTSVDFLIGHSDVRRKIETTRAYELNQDKSEIIELYRQLSGKQKRCVSILMESF